MYSVFPKDTTKWREYILNGDHVDHKHGALTTRQHYCNPNMLTKGDKHVISVVELISLFGKAKRKRRNLSTTNRTISFLTGDGLLKLTLSFFHTCIGLTRVSRDFEKPRFHLRADFTI